MFFPFFNQSHLLVRILILMLLRGLGVGFAFGSEI